MNELQHIIEQKQALLHQKFSFPTLENREGMTAEEQNRYINYLAELVCQTNLELRARDIVLQNFLGKQKEYESKLSKMDKALSRMYYLESELWNSFHQ